MLVVDVLERMGGVATRGALIRATSRAAVDAALGAGELVVLARGRYALASTDEALQVAHRLTGVASHESAALLHSWAVLHAPQQPHVTVPRKRHLAEQVNASVHYADLSDDDCDGSVTSQERTLVDCLRLADRSAALAVADSALREGFSRTRLLAIARDLRGPRSAQARAVAEAADARAANPFESALRAIAGEVVGLEVVPQGSLRDGNRFLGRPDLVDERLGIVLEADSFEWHGGRHALTRDARRYNQLVVHGWLVLRFSWEDVMFHPREVMSVLEAAVVEKAQRCACGRRRV
ncbi:hypothetical protein GCM10009623_26060 [Nocardioides aestuarii]|uniref:DUF559 domain-containing protein n=1 Tax=Nocardioides aestuarii TaxID=252231 RepID=A0ABW4TP70_9ACTN